MPWSLSDLPPGTSKLPKGAQRIFIRVANAVLSDSGDDEQAIQAGWHEVKKYYEKTDGKWQRKTAEADADPGLAQALLVIDAPDAPGEILSDALEFLLSETADFAAQGAGRNSGDAPGSGPGGECVCPECGHTQAHTTGEPCNEQTCSQCGATMTRDEAVSADADEPDVQRFEAGWGGLSDSEVRTAIYSKLAPNTDPWRANVSILSIYSDYFLMRDDQKRKYYRQEFSVDDSGTVNLGKKVQMRRVWQKIETEEPMTLDAFLADMGSMSADEVRAAVRTALRENAVPTAANPSGDRPWLVELFEDAVIVSHGRGVMDEETRYMRMSYTVKDGEIELGDAEEVEQVWVEADADGATFVFAADHEAVTDGAAHFDVSNIASARLALARVARYESKPDWFDGSVEDLRKQVRADIYGRYPALKQSAGESDVYELLPAEAVDVEVGEIAASMESFIAGADDFDAVTALAAAMPQLDGVIQADAIETIQTQAEERALTLAAEGREFCTAAYSASPDDFDWEDKGDHITFNVSCGQVDTPLVSPMVADRSKATPVVFPREEIEANFPRMRREMKLGRVFGEADHPPGKPRIRETCVVFDSIDIDGTDIVASGRTTKNTAGQDIADLVRSGINIEWSLRGWGKPEKSTWESDGEFKGREVVIARDFLLNTFDVVTKGLASTGFRQIAADHTGGTSMGAENNDLDPEQIQADADAEPTTDAEPQEPQTDPEPNEPQTPAEPEPAQASAPAPEQQPMQADLSGVDIDEKIQKGIQDAMAEQQRIAQVSGAIDSVLAGANLDDAMKKTMRKHFEAAATIEEVQSIAADIEPVLARLSRPDDVLPAGRGQIIAAGSNDKPLDRYMMAGDGSIVERPRTVEGVVEVLCAGLEDSGQESWNNDAWAFRKILDNYRAPQGVPQAGACLASLTADGYQRFMAATQTTAVMGLQTPQVLPMLRMLYPRVIYRELCSVQPLSQPSGRAYWLDFTKQDTSASISDRDNFDRYWADRETEATTKKQLGLSLSYADVSVKEKSIYYSLAHELIQDMAAVHGVNAQQELLRKAVDEIAYELNYEVIFEMWDAATGSAQTFGTQLPASGYDNLRDWYQMLVPTLNKAAAEILRDNGGRGPNWLVMDPMAAAFATSLSSFERDGNVQDDQFGLGLKRIGTLAEEWTCYKADWFTSNRILMGYKGNDWTEAGYVYLPYIPLYISPEDYTASTNVSEQSVTSRYAKYFARPGLFGTCTIADQAGVNPF